MVYRYGVDDTGFTVFFLLQLLWVYVFFPCSVTEMPFLHLFFFSRTITIKVCTTEALWFRFLVVKNEECQNCFARVITGPFNILYFQNTRQNRTCFCVFIVLVRWRKILFAFLCLKIYFFHFHFWRIFSLDIDILADNLFFLSPL